MQRSHWMHIRIVESNSSVSFPFPSSCIALACKQLLLFPNKAIIPLTEPSEDSTTLEFRFASSDSENWSGRGRLFGLVEDNASVQIWRSHWQYHLDDWQANRRTSAFKPCCVLWMVQQHSKCYLIIIPWGDISRPSGRGSCASTSLCTRPESWLSGIEAHQISRKFLAHPLS